jgi:hypothetical protein
MLDNKSTVLGGTGRQLEALTQKLVDARVRLSEAEQAYNQVKAGEATNYESVPAVVKSSSVHKARSRGRSGKEAAEISQRYGSEHPKFVAATSDLSAARDNTRSRVITGRECRQGIRRGSGHREDHSRGVGAIQGHHPDLNRKEIQLGMLEQRHDHRSSTKPSCPASRKPAPPRNAQAPSCRVVDHGRSGLSPIRPAKTRTVMIATALAVLVGALWRRDPLSLEEHIADERDIERKLQRPLLAALPILPAGEEENRGQAISGQPQ